MNVDMMIKSGREAGAGDDLPLFSFNIFSLVFQRWHLKKWTLYDILLIGF